MSKRITISLPEKSLSFISNYKRRHGLTSSSQVVLRALQLLEQETLFDMFTDMSKENQKVHIVTASEQEAEGFLDESW